jgi:hypothetical protein
MTTLKRRRPASKQRRRRDSTQCKFVFCFFNLYCIVYTTCFLNCLRLHISHTIEHQSNKILSNFEHNKNVFVKCLIESMTPLATLNLNNWVTKYIKSICHGYHLLLGELAAT